MVYQPDDHDPGKSRELAFLVEALGIDELYERVNALDNKGGLPKAGEWNPTNDPMVQRSFHGEVGTLSSGPNEENVGRLDVVDPDHLVKLKALAELQEQEAKERADREEAERAIREEANSSLKDAEESKAEDKKPEQKVSTPASRTSTSAKK